jgi:hypothetical protein
MPFVPQGQHDAFATNMLSLRGKRHSQPLICNHFASNISKDMNMNMDMNTLASEDHVAGLMYAKIHQLPPKGRLELANYVDLLLHKYRADEPKKPFFGCMKGIVTWMSDDFNAPLDDFKDYM